MILKSGFSPVGSCYESGCGILNQLKFAERHKQRKLREAKEMTEQQTRGNVRKAFSH